MMDVQCWGPERWSVTVKRLALGVARDRPTAAAFLGAFHAATLVS